MHHQYHDLIKAFENAAENQTFEQLRPMYEKHPYFKELSRII